MITCGRNPASHAGSGSPAGSIPAPGTNGRKPEYGGRLPGVPQIVSRFQHMACRKDGKVSGDGQHHKLRDGFRISRLVMSIIV